MDCNSPSNNKTLDLLDTENIPYIKYKTKKPSN